MSDDGLVSGPKLVAFKMCNCVAQDRVLNKYILTEAQWRCVT